MCPLSRWIKDAFLQAGKGKTLYTVKGEKSAIWMTFKDDLTAFNGKKKSSFKGKGTCNRDVSSLAFRYLQKEGGIATHWLADKDPSDMVCTALQMLALEVVVRNRLAGSTAKKFALSDGTALTKPLVELYYKKDELGDPFISVDQALALGIVSSPEVLDSIKAQALRVNTKLKVFFDRAGLELVDFKLEFGVLNDTLVLGDEISCDSCRLWHKVSGKRMDKDRFRLNLGGVAIAYQEVSQILKQTWSKELE